MHIIRHLIYQLTVVMGLLLAGCSITQQHEQIAESQTLRLNHIQVMGSHNSYKQAMSPEFRTQLAKTNPEAARHLDYEHATLTEQLNLGLRKFELDLFFDPSGEQYQLNTTGFAVGHVQIIDFNSHCASLTVCLRQLKSWSADHPNHLPITISFNAKDQQIPGLPDPQPFTMATWSLLEQIIQQEMAGRLITPGQVIGAQGQLTWPSLTDSRGKYLLVLDEQGSKLQEYMTGWRERSLFGNVGEGEPGAAVMIVNDPIQDFAEIQRLVAAGYLVRTRADADTEEARRNDTRRRDRAFASGAHFVSTDYYAKSQRFTSRYQVQLPPRGGVARCNPVTAPNCDQSQLNE